MCPLGVKNMSEMYRERENQFTRLGVNFFSVFLLFFTGNA